MPIEGPALGYWLAQRAGKLTASRLPDAIATLKSGKFAASRGELLHELLAERITGESVRHYVNAAMQWGLDNEDPAKSLYEAVRGVWIVNVGFVEHPTIEYFGATPDGLIGKDGLIEVKCPTTTTYIKWRLSEGVPEEHVPQMLGQLACTGRTWCDFMAYDPRIKDESMQYFIRRFEPAKAAIEQIEDAAREFLRELDAMFDLFVHSPDDSTPPQS